MRLHAMIETACVLAVLCTIASCAAPVGRDTQARQDRLTRTLEELSAIGETTSLADARFSQAHARSSLWDPYDFIVSARPGVYFLEPYDAGRLPVLFVHGIGGTPLEFRYLIEHLDRRHVQAWVYSYPSGMHLDSIAEHLSGTVAQLQARHRTGRLIIVAYSMGGLVSRGFLLRQEQFAHVQVPLFVTISTPWEGHAAATWGVKYAPTVLDVWRDIAPGSDYLRGLFSAPLAASTDYRLIFTYARKTASFGASDDRTVTVASQLSLPAQRAAARLYGFDDTHAGVLRNPGVAALLNELLAAHAVTDEHRVEVSP
jgi:pimeloyl-ACP methyl ester carboxylesterase